MKRRLDLRTGRPVWQAYRAPRVRTDPLDADARTEILVIGMGISGAQIAEALSSAGREVMCIDRRGPGFGSTAATTALVQYDIDQPLVRLGALIGQERAVRAWRRSALALANLRAKLAELGTDCRMAERPTLYLAGTDLDAGGLIEEAAMRQAAGLQARFLRQGGLAERFGIARRGALLIHGNVVLDPRRLVSGFLAAARHAGARLHAPVEALSLARRADGILVRTKAGPTIEAEHVVLATGYELMKPVPSSNHRILSTYAIATRPQKGRLWPEEAMIWEASTPYFYARAAPDGRIICGGADEDFLDEDRRDRLLAAKSARLARQLSRLFPGVDSAPEFRWTGSFGSTADGLPRIGPVPRHPRLFAVLGYGGNGIVFSRMAAEMAHAHIIRSADPDADLFSLS